MDYKTTLNLPSTDFPMKAGLPLNEPKTLRFWQEEDIYGEIRKKYSGKPKYILHDGPPYANGSIHIGHALNKILKDMIVRCKTMQGFDAPYVPGWDCHGLPVEHQLFKELKITKEQISQIEFRKKAYAYAMRFVTIQKEEFMRLGIFGDWNNPYLTLDKRYEYEIVRALGELVRNGFICRGLKPVNWCSTCETALAEAEVEYEDKASPSIYVKFKIIDGSLFPKDSSLVIWTTTPWTLYANVAVAAHCNVQYVVVETGKGNLVIAKNLLRNALKDMELSENDSTCLKTISGRELEGVLYQHPFLEDTITRKVILADYVSQDEGTGLVHIAPGHGMEDYVAGLRYGLDILMPVDKQGKFDQTVKDFSGLHVFSANKAIIEKLEGLKCLLFYGQKQHSYPHCWRCKSPVLFRATKQWFLGLEHKELRKAIVKAIEKDICFIPESGRGRIKAMVELRPDWCLSRQRYWGVPIPALHCTQCNEEILDAGVIANFAQRVLSEGTQAWFKEDAAVFIPEKFMCPHCKNTAFRRGEDILDVWFDSGVSHRAVLMADTQLAFPASLYVEGSDQHRGWFQASLIASMAIEGKSPFKAVLTHGFVVDGEGKKMSKSMGNVVSPEEVIREYGADILRLWTASSNYSEDVRISKDILSRLSDAYRKIRNTVRFLLGNLSDFSPEKDAIEYTQMLEVDRYILSCAYSLLEKVTKYYEAFEFYKVYQEIYQFCIVQMSNFYLDIIKDRMYTFKKDGLERRSAQTVMHDILVILVKIIAPIVPFTAEEIWRHVAVEDKEKSVHCARWPEKKSKYIDDELQNKWYNLLQFRNKVLKAVEEKRVSAEIGSSLEASLAIGITKENSYLKELLYSLPEVFIVSAVSLEDAQEPFIRVLKAKGTKCSRCWNYSQDTGENTQYPQICSKCVRALTG
ncbi:MAG: isoleucine--tRNA ligase [Omnitrophica WOR_2 bacterium GWF2_43_52]|nr:MAG: isoleucine--tRNA ligase [Omnitrophica WOR_2 bacterium GWA2_44_7]OGX20909.1 MAG: isoleucine--tRNA ligase [Omnitrophica WOR_2 bacterium GWF2_43_52]OGX57072.1 MAG: isoleucine--tRNA ligase [Omnitrophica WOR_2 bacterium RIFOXYC2_FULL_43_9]HAH21084.1 isoleucine--tRNA ligase [Candidatus Omnitrophota bacterium]HBG63313.1 isoleucine--tRNA ligase [Candidatus Omnitrophota bacterium]